MKVKIDQCCENCERCGMKYMKNTYPQQGNGQEPQFQSWATDALRATSRVGARKVPRSGCSRGFSTRHPRSAQKKPHSVCTHNAKRATWTLARKSPRQQCRHHPILSKAILPSFSQRPFAPVYLPNWEEKSPDQCLIRPPAPPNTSRNPFPTQPRHFSFPR